jgi:uncharacterized protein DUF6703
VRGDAEPRLPGWHDAAVSAAGPDPSAPRPSGLRTSVERVSAPTLVRLSRLPRMVPFIIMLALIVAGLLVHGPIGFALIMLGVLFLLWLLYLGWPALAPVERLMRFAVVLLGTALAVTQLFSG